MFTFSLISNTSIRYACINYIFPCQSYKMLYLSEDVLSTTTLRPEKLPGTGRAELLPQQHQLLQQTRCQRAGLNTYMIGSSGADTSILYHFIVFHTSQRSIVLICICLIYSLIADCAHRWDITHLFKASIIKTKRQ